jgi:hypothetical protein
VWFLLVDSIGKKIKVADDVARQIGLCDYFDEEFFKTKKIIYLPVLR